MYKKLITDYSSCNHWIYNKTNISSCNTVSKIKTTADTLSFLGDTSNCLMGTSLLRGSSIEQHEVLRSAVELRVSFLKSIIGNYIRSGSCIKEIAGILFTAQCRLSDVICLQNVELTRAFLKEQDLISPENSNKKDSLKD